MSDDEVLGKFRLENVIIMAALSSLERTIVLPSSRDSRVEIFGVAIHEELLHSSFLPVFRAPGGKSTCGICWSVATKKTDCQSIRIQQPQELVMLMHHKL